MSGHFGVIGFPIKHSLSPEMFQAAFWEYNMDSEYDRFEVHPDELKTFLDEVKERPISGLSVTIPHKETIIPYLDTIGAHAKRIGAVNTVANVDGKLKGYNTDWIGAKRAIEDIIDIEGKDVLVLGAGGAAAAIVYACIKEGAQVTILNRTLGNAQKIAERFSNIAEIKVGLLQDIMQYRSHLLIHTTSVGMGDDHKNSLVPFEYLKRGLVVFDIVYTPMDNRLNKDAKAAECRIIPGYKMLLHQAEKQFDIWFKKKPRVEKMEEALLASLRE